jgi:hypothetical protein
MHLKLLLVIFGAMVTLTGCQPLQKKLEVCQGKPGLFDSLVVLEARGANVTGFLAKGRCSLQYHVDGKSYKENLSITIAVNPPTDFYLRGDVSIVPKAVVAASNSEEFWLALRPKEISTYWWGKWEQQENHYDLALSPRVMLEAFGIATIDVNDAWSLTNEGPYDILTKIDEQAKTTRKMYVYSCDYTVRVIEYYDENEQVALVAELDKYKKVTEDFSVPTKITLSRPGTGKQKDWVKMTFTSVKSKDFTEKNLTNFQRRPPRGFKHIYFIIDGEPIELRE